MDNSILKSHAKPVAFMKKRPSSLIIGIVAILIGLTVIYGWATNTVYLRTWLPTSESMNPVSALGIILLGITLLFVWRKQYKISRILSIVIAFFALLPLFSVPLPFLLFAHKVAQTYSPNVIPVFTSITFICLAAALFFLTLNRRRYYWLAHFALIASSLIVAYNLLGQLYAYNTVTTIGNGFVMSFSLTISLLIVAAASSVELITKQYGESLKIHFGWTTWLIIVTIVLAQTATYIGWKIFTDRNVQLAQSSFDDSTASIKNALNTQFTAYTNALRGFQGLYLSSSDVNKKEFQGYYATTGIAKQYPGIRTIAYIAKVPQQNLAAFTKKISDQLPGTETFSVTGLTSLPLHYVITYYAEQDSPTGADLSGTPDRVVTFNKADATLSPVASGTVTLPQSVAGTQQKGFFIVVPVEYESDPTKVVGYVSAVFNYSDFFKATFNSSVATDNLNIDMIDTQNGETVLSIHNNPNDDAFHSDAKIVVADRTWDLKIAAPANYGTNDQSSLPLSIFAGGQAFTILLIIIFWLQAVGRRNALKLVKKATKELQLERNAAVANDQRSTAILSSIGDGVLVIDKNKRIIILNQAARTMSGTTDIDAIGLPYDDVLRFEFEATGKENSTFIHRALSGHLTHMTNHTVIVTKTGAKIPVADSAAPIRDRHGEIIGAIVVFRDVTKEYELDKAKTEFVSLASHQLRTPLSAINWYGEMLLGGDAGKLNKDQQEYIGEIYEGSQRMVELVNSLLNVSRLEVGKLVSQPEATDLEQVIRSIEKELEVSVQAKKLRLSTHIGTLPPIFADPKQLRMIVQNLMSNAVKYTDLSGKVDVTLRHATKEDKLAADIHNDEQFWFFSVRDNGYGIPAAQQHKIFEKLFRADNVRRLDVEGTGLGLYIVKEVVEKMGGKTWFDSREGEETTFYVIAPLSIKRIKH